MHQFLQGATFHIEHVVPKSLGGPASELNLCLACPSCNLHKSNRMEALDPKSGETVKLFNPLADSWWRHFRIEGWRIEGKTKCGRATVDALQFNHPRRLKVREAESFFGLFPPDA